MATNLVDKKITDLHPADYNPRVELQPGDPDWDRLLHSIETYGLAVPLIWNKTTGRLVGGHQRLAVLKHLGHKKVSVVEVELDENRERALNLALNKVDGRWDDAKLLALLDELQAEGSDIAAIGFDEDEMYEVMRRLDQESASSFLDDMLDDPEHEEPDESFTDQVPEAFHRNWHLISYSVLAAERDIILEAIAAAKAEGADTSAKALLNIMQELIDTHEEEHDATEASNQDADGPQPAATQGS